MSAIGARRPRLDGEAKVTGATRYASDQAVPGLLQARLVLSLEAHARILGIDTAAALAAPGVVAVLTAADLPLAGGDESRRLEPLAREEVLFAGQPVAIVVAETEAAAEDGAELVAVEYEPLPAVLDLETAVAPGATLVRALRAGGGEGGDVSMHADVGDAREESPEGEERLSANVIGRHLHREGDAAAALAASAAVVRARFRTSWVYQAYVEPQAAVAWVEDGGDLVVLTGTQGTFYTREQLARAFDLPLSRVRIVPAAVGGAFGGKILVVEPLAAAAALALRRPVRLAFTRAEDFAAANPAPGFVIELEAGAGRDGRLTALRARLLVDSGAFADWAIDGLAAAIAAGPYRWPAYEIRSYGVRTNRFPAGAYRAPGAPQTAFALESLLDELAAELGLDPLELRLANVAREGDARVSGGEWPRIGLAECLEALREHPLWRGRASLPPGEGVGLAAGHWPGGRSPAAAVCRLDADGRLTVVTGTVDLTGTATAFAAIASEALGVPVEEVTVRVADTSTAPPSPMSGGSMVTYTAGRAVELAAADARRQLLEIAARELEADPDDLEVVQGTVRPRGAPGQGLTVEELARRIYRWGTSHPPVEGHAASAPPALAPLTAAELAHVRADRETGRVEVLAVVVAQDVGRALNPDLVEGQLRGGVAQGIGWALLEELVHDERGHLLTGSFLSYAAPGAAEVPPVETILVEVPAPDGPFGAKGVGEGPVVPTAAAVANAIAVATGVRLRELPMTPRRVWSALAEREDV